MFLDSMTAFDFRTSKPCGSEIPFPGFTESDTHRETRSPLLTAADRSAASPRSFPSRICLSACSNSHFEQPALQNEDEQDSEGEEERDDSEVQDEQETEEEDESEVTYKSEESVSEETSEERVLSE